MRHEIIVYVNDLVVSRFFYRDILMLGEPVVDSADIVIFDLDNGNAALSLIRSSAAFLEHTSAATAFAIEHPNFEAVKNSLNAQKYPVTECGQRIGRKYFRTNDPEGNPVLICQQIN